MGRWVDGKAGCLGVRSALGAELNFVGGLTLMIFGFLEVNGLSATPISRLPTLGRERVQ